MLKQRVITAIILLPIVLGIIFYTPSHIFSFMLALVFCSAAWEWSQLIPIHQYWLQSVYVMLFAVITASLMYADLFVVAAFLAIFITLFLTIALIAYPRWQSLWAHKVSILLFGWLLLAACFCALSVIRDFAHGQALFLYLLCLIWGADTGAYFAGKYFGRHKLLVHVSPGKTIEGVIGGIITSILVAVIAGIYFDISMHVWSAWLILALTVAIVSVIGDLMISLFKRRLGLKDISQLLPGHGGLLDRIDSLITAAPVFILGMISLSLI